MVYWSIAGTEERGGKEGGENPLPNLPCVFMQGRPNQKSKEGGGGRETGGEKRGKKERKSEKGKKEKAIKRTQDCIIKENRKKKREIDTGCAHTM